MKKNLYTNAVKEIKAPKALIEKTVSSLSSAEPHKEVITMKKNNFFKLKLTSAIAASLVLILSLSMILFTGNSTPPSPESAPVSHPFIMSVQAIDSPYEASTMDEITNEAYVKINKIKNFGQGAETKTHGYYNKENEYVLIDEYQDLLRIEKEFTLELNCTGENIKNITYTVHNTFLTYMPTYEGLIKAVDLTKEEREKFNAYTSFGGFGWASSCTFDYNCQPKSTLDIELPEDSLDGTLPLRIAFNLKLEDGKYVIKSIDDCDLMTIYEEEFNARSEEYALDITANFTDGTSTTKTLKFKCENDGTHLYLSAIEANA